VRSMVRLDSRKPGVAKLTTRGPEAGLPMP